MRKFLKYVSIYSLSLILLIIGMEYMLRRIPNPLSFKKELIESHTQDTKNLIIGSSVVNCGINPVYLADSTYNLAISGEWFRFNQLLLEKYIQQMPHLKNIFGAFVFIRYGVTTVSRQTKAASSTTKSTWVSVEQKTNFIM